MTDYFSKTETPKSKMTVGELGCLMSHGLEELKLWKKESSQMKHRVEGMTVAECEEILSKRSRKHVSSFNAEIEISKINDKLDRLINNINMLAELFCKDIK